MVPITRQTHLGPASLAMLAGWLLACVLDFGVFRYGQHSQNLGGVSLVELAAVPLALFGVWTAGRSGPLAGQRSVSRVFGYLVAAIGAFVFAYVSLLIEGVVLVAMMSRARTRLVPHPGDEERFKQKWMDWQRRVSEFEASEQRRVASCDIWFPVAPSPTASLIGVFGGSATSWSILLGTVGPSLLGASPLAVVNLSKRRATGLLEALAGSRGLPVISVAMPSNLDGLELFQGMGWDALTSLIAEALHAGEVDAAASRRERQEDRAILRDIAECLTPGGRVGIGRLRAGVRVVINQRRAPAGPDDLLSLDEFERLNGLYGETVRTHGGVLERGTRLDWALKDLEILDGERSTAPSDRPPDDDRPDGSLEVYAIDERAEELDNEILVDLLFQLVLRRVRQGETRAGTLVVLGADRIRRQGLESLSSYCEREGLRTLLFFEHLRADATEVIGAGGAAAAFLALPNPKEAQEAVAFIGSEHRFVLSQHTRGVSDSVTRTWGQDMGQNWSPTGGGGSFSESFSEALGRSEEYSEADQRVFEPIVEPNELMGLPATAMIYVEVRPNGARRVVVVDFNPQIVLAQRVATRPFELAAR